MEDFKTAPIGERLKHWRTQRKISQLDLALECDTSARHLSFIETGKAQPTRELLINLARAMEIPPSALNNILISAGYAPNYQESGLSTEESDQLHQQLKDMAERNGNNPSILVNKHWDILYSNPAFSKLCQHFLGDCELTKGQPCNMLRLFLHPQGLISFAPEPEELYRSLMSRARRAMTVINNDQQLEQLMLEMRDYKPASLDNDYMIAPQLMTVLTLNKDEAQLELLAMTATLGEPLNISFGECQLEFCIPANDNSKTLLDEICT
jgi:transcriptional regulator with XRE-family HTH domain